MAAAPAGRDTIRMSREGGGGDGSYLESRCAERAGIEVEQHAAPIFEAIDRISGVARNKPPEFDTKLVRDRAMPIATEYTCNDRQKGLSR